MSEDPSAADRLLRGAKWSPALLAGGLFWLGSVELVAVLFLLVVQAVLLLGAWGYGRIR